MTAQPPPRNGNGGGFLSGIPPWIVVVLAGIGAPTSIGTAILSRSNETQMALHTREIELLQEKIAGLVSTLSAVSASLATRPSMSEVASFRSDITKLQSEMQERVTKTTRVESMEGLNRADQELRQRIERLQELVYRHHEELLERTAPPVRPQGRDQWIPSPDTSGRERCDGSDC